ncbi:hypothetical protein [Limnofasciculus baicalensis]|uniref:Uncharacterized protein n=1 Tax=Limnofasciculus baicalensis BBK-W-15 TaxID=2699891 RepID=A0AAE3KT69_9CYAN|nr:hypothetical protein [Limnofasciculus baicalensis]MCP2730217.1 hypothetical protein [Limnofasciculus baicalensis BBK-W-15]
MRDENFVWQCQSCQRPYLHSAGGICTNCLTHLPTVANKKCRDLYARNYYATEAAKMKRAAMLNEE